MDYNFIYMSIFGDPHLKINRVWMSLTNETHEQLSYFVYDQLMDINGISGMFGIRDLLDNHMKEELK